MDCQAVEVDYQDDHGQGDPGAPEDIGDGDGPKGVVWIG